MSWLFSRALVEEFSAATCSDGARSALSSGSPTPPLFLPSDKTTAFSRLSRFGMTFGHLTDELGAEVLMWCQAVSRAKTSAWQEKAPESPGNARACGNTWRELLAKFDPDSCSWRTPQLSLLGGCQSSLQTWPRSGMAVDGLCWELPMLGRRIRETDSGCLLPTPLTIAVSTNKAEQTYQRDMERVGNATWQAVLAVAARKWPTPTVCGNHNRKGASATSGDGLATAVKNFRTPNASDARKWSNDTQAEREAQGRQVMLCHQLQTGGALNPTWVEWLMGWPLGWTDLKPLEMGKSHCAQQLHGGC